MYKCLIFVQKDLVAFREVRKYDDEINCIESIKY